MFKVAVTYLVASWLIVQVVGIMTELLSLFDALDTFVVIVCARYGWLGRDRTETSR